MRTKNLMGLLWVVSLAVSAFGCAVDSGVDMIDGAIEDCEGDRRGDECEGTHVAPGEDGSTDESVPPRDSGADADVDPNTDEDVDPQPDASDPVVDEDVVVDEDDAPDAEVASPDAGEDAGQDAGEDAEVEPPPPPPNCRDDYECGVYGACDETLAVPACDCITGYVDSGAGCAWGGGLVDATLDDASAWGGQNMTIASGVARFGHQGSGLSCELGLLEQQLQMPTRAESQAFVLELDVLSSCTNSDAEECAPLQIELGTSANRLVVAGGPGAATTPIARTVSMCLGETGYGPNVALRVRPGLAYHGGELPLVCESAAWPAIDRIAIRPAADGECVNGQAFLGRLTSPAGWSLTNATVASNQLAIAAGGRAETLAAFTKQSSSQALRLGSVTGTARYFDIKLDGLTWARIDRRYVTLPCVPAWALGSSHRVEITAVNGTLTIPILDLTSDPNCGDSRFDEGFDRPTWGSSWSTNEGFITRVMPSYTTYGGELTTSTSLRASTRFPARLGVVYRLAQQARYIRSNASSSSTIDFALDTSAGESMMSNLWSVRTVCFPNAWERQLTTLRVDVTLVVPAGGTTARAVVDDLGLFTVDPATCE